MATPIAGTVTVASAATAVAFSASRSRVIALTVRAQEGNTGIVYLGDSGVSASSGFPLHQGTDGVHSEHRLDIPPGESISLEDLYLDAATNDDAADYFGLVQ